MFTCADTGINVVVLTVTDNNGNTDTCHAIVSVFGVLLDLEPINGLPTVCPGISGIPYEVTPDPAAFSYQWSYSGTGATIIGNGEPSVEINYAPNATAGILTVEFVSACGETDNSVSMAIVIASEFVCNTALSCLIDDLLVIQTMINFPGGINLFKASNSVSSAALIEDNTSVIFRAGQEINLIQTFEVEKGALFLAEIQGCQETLQGFTPKKE